MMRSVGARLLTGRINSLLPVFIGFMLIVTGCERPADEPPAGDPAPATTPPEEADAGSGTSSSDDSSTTEDSRGLLTIGGEGLRVFLVGSGSSRALPFGTSYEVIRRTVSAILGSDPVEEGASLECQTRYARWPGDFTTWYIEDHFVGWALAGDASISMVSGVGIGSPRSELESAHAAEVFTSSLGTEFSVGGMAGLLDGGGDSARVTHLWAGQACIAR